MSDLPACPRCGNNRNSVPNGTRQWYCKRCKGLYDDMPNEGGDYSDFNAGVRLEREERRQERQRERRGGRR